MSTAPLRSALRQGLRWIALAAALSGVAALVWWFGIRRPDMLREREAQAAIALGRQYLQKGRPERALWAVKPIAPDGPWAAGALAVKGIALAALDRPEEARPLLERTIKLDSKQPLAAKVLAAVYFSANEPERGFQMLELAARLDKDDFRPWFAAGEALMYQSQPADAIRAYREALKRRPDHDESKIGLADALLATGATAEATPLLEAALRAHPRDARVLCLAARHARLLGRPEEMGDFAQRALALEPDRVEALVLRAQFLRQTGRYQEALALAERAVVLAPNDLAALNLLALLEASLGLKERSAATSARHRKAQARLDRIEELSDAMRKRPDDPEPRWRMGELAALGGDTVLAINSFRAALALDPDCLPARKGLISLNLRAQGARLPPSSEEPSPP
jgi:tetratricopeptide (TPR) repeat protein